jgi:uncharacterized membrane protein YoaK (UPF0700 family)
MLVGVFIVAAGSSRALDPRILDLQAALLCAAMGMQNSMVTRLSGAVVRTTHLTGVVTDLGIEAAQWVRWMRARAAFVRRHAGGHELVPPRAGRSVLLLSITSSFTVGAGLGASLTLHHGRWAMLVPMLALALAGMYAFRTSGTQATP